MPVRYLLLKQSHFLVGLLIFLTCIFIYLANRELISSSDNIPNALIGFNWLINHDLDFDALRGTFGNCLSCSDGNPYYLTAAPNGHLTSTYPVGVAIASFPLYFLFFLYLKFISFFHLVDGQQAAALFNIFAKDFSDHRQHFEKLAATLVTALSVVFFYFATRLKFNSGIALLSTFIFAFATPTWALISQGLRQHTVSNWVVTALILCLFKAHRSTAWRQRGLLIASGFLCGLLPGIRVTSWLFAIATFVYVAYTYRKATLFWLLGAFSFLLNAAWNVYFFGFSLRNLIVGGYSSLFESGASSYQFDWNDSIEAFTGLLAAPSDGLFVYSPILLFALMGFYWIWRSRQGRDEQYLLCLFLACLLLLIHYCFYIPWTGGVGSFGSRFMSDTVPVLCFGLPYTLVQLTAVSLTPFPRRLGIALLSILLAASVLIQIVGVFGSTPWGSIPVPLKQGRDRLWSLQDTEIQRHAASLWHKISNPIADLEKYTQGTQGRILAIQEQGQQSLTQPVQGRTSKRVVLTADLLNTGSSRWYGYQTGLGQGEVRVRGQFLNAKGKLIKTGDENLLYVSGSPQSGQNATAIGSVVLPRQPGQYQLQFDLIIQGQEHRFTIDDTLPTRLTVEVKPRKRDRNAAQVPRSALK
jgi:hypothetical protein